MKKKVALPLVVLIGIILGCVLLFEEFGRNLQHSETPGEGYVTIKGKLPSGHTKVVAVYPSGYEIVNFTGGVFSIDVRTDSPVLLLFFEDNGDYLGYLYLKNGIESLPMTRTREGVTVINLQDLTINGTVLTPSHNPIGDEINLSPEERAIVAQLDDFFAVIARNPDADGDMKPDLMEGESYDFFILYFVEAGQFSDNLTPSVITPANIVAYRLAFCITTESPPESVFFTGPEGSGLNNTPSDQAMELLPGVFGYGTPLMYEPPVPLGGNYIITYGGRRLVFTMPDQSSASSHIVLAVPTVTLNPNGTINKISWRYLTGDGSGEVNPEGIFSSLEIDIDGTGAPYQNYPQPNRMYSSGWIPITTKEHVLPTQSIKWSDVTIIYMAYSDIYGNHYVASFHK